MPNSKSAKKRLKQNFTRRDENLSIKRAVRSQVRKVREAIGEGNAETAATEFRLAVKKLDRAGAKNIIHRNKTARMKSRLSAGVKKIQQG